MLYGFKQPDAIVFLFRYPSVYEAHFIHPKIGNSRKDAIVCLSNVMSSLHLIKSIYNFRSISCKVLAC